MSSSIRLLPVLRPDRIHVDLFQSLLGLKNSTINLERNVATDNSRKNSYQTQINFSGLDLSEEAKNSKSFTSKNKIQKIMGKHLKYEITKVLTSSSKPLTENNHPDTALNNL